MIFPDSSSSEFIQFPVLVSAQNQGLQCKRSCPSPPSMYNWYHLVLCFDNYL